jgi:hypothetical protein
LRAVGESRQRVFGGGAPRFLAFTPDHRDLLGQAQREHEHLEHRADLQPVFGDPIDREITEVA